MTRIANREILTFNAFNWRLMDLPVLLWLRVALWVSIGQQEKEEEEEGNCPF